MAASRFSAAAFALRWTSMYASIRSRRWKRFAAMGRSYRKDRPTTDVTSNMGGRIRAVGGLTALLLLGSHAPAHAGGPVRVVEAEKMRSVAGVVVRAPQAV